MNKFLYYITLFTCALLLGAMLISIWYYGELIAGPYFSTPKKVKLGPGESLWQTIHLSRKYPSVLQYFRNTLYRFNRIHLKLPYLAEERWRLKWKLERLRITGSGKKTYYPACRNCEGQITSEEAIQFSSPEYPHGRDIYLTFDTIRVEDIAVFRLVFTKLPTDYTASAPDVSVFPFPMFRFFNKQISFLTDGSKILKGVLPARLEYILYPCGALRAKADHQTGSKSLPFIALGELLNKPWVFILLLLLMGIFTLRWSRKIEVISRSSDETMTWYAGLMLVVIIAMAVVIRWQYLDHFAPDFDESFSWNMVNRPLPDMMVQLLKDKHPPLFYILLKAWGELFGQTVPTLRLFSLLCSAVTVLILFFIGKQLQGVTLGMLISACYTLLPYDITESQQIRMYPLLITLSMALFLVVLHTPSKPGKRDLLALSLVSSALLLTHYFAVFPFFSAAVWWIWTRISKGVRQVSLKEIGFRFIIPLCLLFAWTIPNYVFMENRHAFHLSSFAMDQAVYLFWLFSPIPWKEFHSLWLIIAGILWLSFFIVGIVHLCRREKGLLIGLGILAPIMSLLLLSHFVALFKPRTTSFMLPLIVICVVEGFSKIWSYHRLTGYIVAALLILSISWGIYRHYQQGYLLYQSEPTILGMPRRFLPNSTFNEIYDNHVQRSTPQRKRSLIPNSR